MKLRQTHPIEVSAAKADISRATGYRIAQDPQLPSQKAQPRERRRPYPLEAIFDTEVVPLLKEAPGLRPVAIFEEILRRHPELSPGVRRTLERRIRSWRAQHGAEQDVIFRQVHEPGRMGLSDFTDLSALGVMIDGQPLAHMLFHFRLPWSGFEHAHVILGGESHVALVLQLRLLWSFDSLPRISWEGFMSVSDWAGAVADWRDALESMKGFLAPVFRRSEQRVSAGAFIDGLLSGAARKTGWMLAEEAGLEQPYRIQSLLGRSVWSADDLCSRGREYTLEALADPDGVLVVDETGFLKKGSHSVGVGRQYSGTAGRIENCQIGVFASYASRWGHALIDRRLYLPKDWAGDAARRAKAHVPEDVDFATKPAMACDMVAKLLDEGTPCAFVLADAVYGSDHRFRRMLEARGQPYVLAVRSNHTLRFLEDWQFIQTDPATMIADLQPEAWQSLSAGEGSKGLRLYDWARLPINHSAEAGFSRWLLARRSPRDPRAISYYFAHARTDTTLADLAAAAGLRWTIEECFQRAKDDLGLDHCEARSWHGWHRHMSLVMAAAAFLVRIAADQRRAAFGKQNETSPAPRAVAA